VRFTRSAADVERADLVVVPGTKATVEDLARLRGAGLDRALTARAAAAAAILGICGGLQMLGEWIDDEVESRAGTVDGLGLLPLWTTFARDKLLRRRAGGCAWLGGARCETGYEIRHGRIARHGGEPLLVADDGAPDGCRAGWTLGTAWHGALEDDRLRRALLHAVAGARGRTFVPGVESFAALRERRRDVLGDLVERHLDTDALLALLDSGAPAELPTIHAEVRQWSVS
jgi:adenosylcobyric acid synthase